MGDLAYWLALNRISVLGARRIRILVDVFGSAKLAFGATESQLLAAGLPARAATVLVQERKAVNPEAEIQRLAMLGFSAILVTEPHYPQLLKQIYDPPAVLFYRGDIAVLNRPCVALVGSRKATEYGRTVAGRLAAELAEYGITVVSGMARGIDTAAHHGALSQGGKTAAVLGCGLDVCYPPENRKLRESIVGQGVLLSEFSPGTQPKPQHFPMRNRIISGLSEAVVVVEAAERSGALITADCALEQDREVFAVPGSINSPSSRGCHRLLKEGAGLAECADDILASLGLPTQQKAAAKETGLTATQAKLLSHLEFEPIHFDEIANRSGLSAPEAAVLMLELELAGVVRKLPGNYYLRV